MVAENDLPQTENICFGSSQLNIFPTIQENLSEVNDLYQLKNLS